METVLVTGGTGTLGRHVVDTLRGAGTAVRVLTRDPGRGAGFVVGDLATGDGLDAAVDGVSTVVHCATGPRFRRVDVEGTERLVERLRTAGVGHLLYVSIVGIDDNPFPYYRAKLEAERVVADSGVPWTVQRATQFHELLLAMVSRVAKLPVAPVPKGFRFQPVDTDAVAARLADLVVQGPSGRARDVGGPRVDPIGDLVQVYGAAVGKSRAVLPVGVPGRVGRAFRAGENLLGPDGETIGGTFDEFLARRFRR